VGYCSVACTSEDWETHCRNIHSSKTENDWDPVLPGLWLGSVCALSNEKFMQGIQAVVTAMPYHRVSEELLSAWLYGKHQRRVLVTDDPSSDIQQYFASTARFIDIHLRRGQNVLVHCFGGHSRSVALVLYYLAVYHSSRFPTVAAALAHVQAVRPSAKPNPGFMQQLENAVAQSKKLLPT
jgi:hypothetical protein